MSNAAATPVGISTGGYVEIPRTLRNIATYAINQPATSSTTVATANSIPQITQGNELFNVAYTALSLTSWLEIEFVSNVRFNDTNSNAWVALFADYSPDALAVYPMQSIAIGYMAPVVLKHYLQPPTLGPIRYSIRFAPSAVQMVFNYYNYGTRTSSRLTFKEWA